MKRKNISAIYTIAILFVCLVVSKNSFSQDSSDNEKNPGLIKSQIEERSFVFVARTVSPMKGGTRQLTSNYTFKVDSAVVESNLPYFGRVYQASYGGDGGIEFASKDFDYKTEPRKKGGWTVQIKTKDLKNNFQMRLTIFENGRASLNASANDRQPISYDGDITAIKK